MNVNALFVSSVSATFELDNKEIYYNHLMSNLKIV